jgi:hypothetical protein
MLISKAYPSSPTDGKCTEVITIEQLIRVLQAHLHLCDDMLKFLEPTVKSACTNDEQRQVEMPNIMVPSRDDHQFEVKPLEIESLGKHCAWPFVSEVVGIR